jgi:hypothetical protein
MRGGFLFLLPIQATSMPEQQRYQVHQGRLWAVDNPPRGAQFCFTVPSNGETRASVVPGDRTGLFDGFAGEGEHIIATWAGRQMLLRLLQRDNEICLL